MLRENNFNCVFDEVLKVKRVTFSNILFCFLMMQETCCKLAARISKSAKCSRTWAEKLRPKCLIQSAWKKTKNILPEPEAPLIGI